MSKIYPAELWPIADIKPYPRNAKIHEPEEVKKLAQSIKTFGWTQPIVVDVDGVIIAGHGRRLAAIELGFDKVPVICRRDLTKVQADALRLADNKVTGTQYDMSLIQDELRALAGQLDGSFELTDLGFDAKELDFSFGDLAEMTEDVFVDDITAAVEQQKLENEQAVQQVDDVAAPIADAFGVKRITIAESRTVRELMSRVEERTGQKGIQALIQFLSASLS